MSGEIDSQEYIARLVLKRDLHQISAEKHLAMKERIDQELNEFGQRRGFANAAKKETATKEYDIEKINWIGKTGAKGPYEYADPKTEGGKSDFQALLQDLKNHGSKFQQGEYFLWVFRDSAGIGRKKLKPS